MGQFDFDAWYRANGSRLVATVRAAVLDEEIARDAVAEACARALRRWGRSVPDNPSGWVYVVALREARKRRSRLDSTETLVDGHLGSSEDHIARHDPVWEAVAQLPDRMRHAVALRYVGDLTEAQVADVLSISRGGASSLLHKAREELRTRLEDEVVDDARP